MLSFQFANYGWGTSASKEFKWVYTHPDPKNPGKLVNSSKSNTCREYFVKNLRYHINQGDGFIPEGRRAYALVSFGMPRNALFEAWQDALNKAAEKSIYIINSYEKHHKWQRTRLYPVKTAGAPMVFFNGPKRWTMSPYLMSMWTLMIRMGRNSWLPKKLLKMGHEEMVKYITKAADNRGGDGYQVARSIHEWDNFMALYKKLFGNNNRKYHWQVSHLNGRSDRPEGIQKLMDGTTGYTSLHNKYYKLKKEAGFK